MLIKNLFNTCCNNSNILSDLPGRSLGLSDLLLGLTDLRFGLNDLRFGDLDLLLGDNDLLGDLGLSGDGLLEYDLLGDRFLFSIIALFSKTKAALLGDNGAMV